MAAEFLPWRAWLRTAAAFGVTPAQFWALSLSEWRALIATADDTALRRAEFEGLAAKFPDELHD